MNSKYIWRKEKAYIASLLEDYPNYPTYIEGRKFRLAHPISEIDENVGGGKAQFKPYNAVDNMLIRIDDDRYLTSLGDVHNQIRVCYDDADEDVQTICYELYFKKYENRKYHTISDLCNSGKIPLSKSAAYDKFDDFLYQVAQQLKMPEVARPSKA